MATQNPGQTLIAESDQVQVWWWGYWGNNQLSTRKQSIISSATDDSNTPDTTLVAGTVMGKIKASGKINVYDPDGTDGTQIAIGVLLDTVNMLVDGTATEQFVAIAQSGLFKADSLTLLDAQSRAALILQGAKFDEGVDGAAALSHPIGVQTSSDDYTVLVADNGKLLISIDTNNTTFTLPTIAVGLTFEFFQAVDIHMTITSGEGDNIVCVPVVGGTASLVADAVTFVTANELVGSWVQVQAVYIGSTLKWLVKQYSNNTITLTDP